MAETPHDEQFESTESGASETYPLQCSALRKNGHVVIKGKACKIVDMSTSKTGKHGHAKVHLVGLDIFTGKKLEDICPSTHNMNVPNVIRKEYQIIDCDDEGFLTLMDDQGETFEDLKLGDNCPNKLDEVKKMVADCSDQQSLVATVLAAMGERQIKEIRHSKAQ